MTLNLFLKYPSAILDSGMLIFLECDNVGYDIHKELAKETKRFDDIDQRLDKISNLLSSEFINKAPANIILENCNKLIELENEYDSSKTKLKYLNQAISKGETNG